MIESASNVCNVLRDIERGLRSRKLVTLNKYYGFNFLSAYLISFYKVLVCKEPWISCVGVHMKGNNYMKAHFMFMSSTSILLSRISLDELVWVARISFNVGI